MRRERSKGKLFERERIEISDLLPLLVKSNQ